MKAVGDVSNQLPAHGEPRLDVGRREVLGPSRQLAVHELVSHALSRFLQPVLHVGAAEGQEELEDHVLGEERVPGHQGDEALQRSPPGLDELRVGSQHPLGRQARHHALGALVQQRLAEDHEIVAAAVHAEPEAPAGHRILHVLQEQALLLRDELHLHGVPGQQRVPRGLQRRGPRAR